MGRPILLPVILFAIILFVVGGIIMMPVDDGIDTKQKNTTEIHDRDLASNNGNTGDSISTEESAITEKQVENEDTIASTNDDVSINDLLLDSGNGLTTAEAENTQNQDAASNQNHESQLRQISGVVQNSMGEMLSSVTVQLDGIVSIVTTTDGRFLFQELEQKSYTLQISAAGYKPITRSSIEAGTNGMVIVLVNDGVLQGKVIDNTNESIAFANISIRALEGIYLQEIRADAEGHFVLQNPPNKDLSIMAVQEGFTDEGGGTTVANSPFSELIVLRLSQPSYSISGMVLNQETGQGIADFHIAANLSDGSLPEPLHTQSTGSGMYRFDNLKPGTYSVSSDAKQNERLNLVVPVDQDFKTVKVLERDAADVNFPVVSGVTVSGIVQTEDGNPVGGAEVKVAKIPSAQTVSGYDGRFVLQSVPVLSLSGQSTLGSEGIRLFASHAQYGSGTSDPLPQGTNAPINNIIIKLQGFATLSGVVVDQNDLPVFNARLNLIDLTTGAQVEQTSQPDGSFVFNEISVAFGVAGEFSGTHQIHVNHEQYSPLQQSLTLNANQNTNVQLKLQGGSQISGMVSDSDGNPVPGVTVRTQLPQGGQAMTTSEANGSYQFPSLAADQYDLHFRLDTNPPLTTVLYGVNAGSSGANAVLQSWEWRVTGTALNEQTGEPVTNYTINFRGNPITPGASRYLQTEGINSHNGTYQKVFHEPGVYHLTFTKPGFENQVTSVTCDLGYREIQYINVRMKPTDQLGGVRGIFNPPANTRLYGINVLGVKNYIANSNAFEITDLPAGSQNLLFFVIDNNGSFAPQQAGGIQFVIEPNNVRNLGTIGSDLMDDFRNF